MAKREYNTSVAVSQRVSKMLRWMASLKNESQKTTLERILLRSYLRKRRELARKMGNCTSIIREE